jgi:hypothetical protein
MLKFFIKLLIFDINLETDNEVCSRYFHTLFGCIKKKVFFSFSKFWGEEVSADPHN